MSPLRHGKQNRRNKHYPRFSDETFERRYERVRTLLNTNDIDALLVYANAGFFMSKLAYLTNYQPPFPTYFLFFADPDTENTLFVGLSNHVQYIREASVVDDLRLLLPDSPQPVVGRLRESGIGAGRVGIVGQDPRYNLSIPHHHYELLNAELDAELVDFTSAYTKHISIVDDEERQRIETASDILDEAMEAFERAIEPGVTELDLKHVLTDICQDYGASLGTDYITSAPMVDAEPGEPLPWHNASSRPVHSGDVITTEITVDYRGYSAQIHRPFAVGAEPTETYRSLFAFAEKLYSRTIDSLQPGNTAGDVAEALSAVNDSEYKIYDVMVHGHGGGYRHPFIGTEQSNYWPGGEDSLTRDWTFEPGTVVVVQPNVLTQDERAGLQLGTSVAIREDGPEVLQQYPVAFPQV